MLKHHEKSDIISIIMDIITTCLCIAITKQSKFYRGELLWTL